MSGEFAASLRELRRGSGLTQDELSGLSTISVRAIRDLETGHAGKPRPATIRLLADGLGLRGPTRDAFLATGRGARPACGPPVPMTSLLGRQVELRAVAEPLLDGHRLVTITGLAGVGKTRLAVEVAHRLADRLTVHWNTTRDLPAGPALLVLDGVDALPPEVPGLLRRHPGLRVLVTAIAPLSEHVVPLVPLDVPSGDVLDSDSARLLIRRIQALDPGFRLDRHTAAAVAEVCRWCDGHPGVLELAGTWCGLWSVDEVVRTLRADPAGLPDRRGDLTAVVGRSLLALSAGERRLLTRLTTIPGSWTVGEAAAVTRGDPVEVGHAVHALLRAGLLRRTGPARFQVLELVRCRWAQPRQATA